MRRARNRAILAGAAGLAVAILITGVFLWQKGGSSDADDRETQESSIIQESITIAADETQSANVSVEGINLTGITMEEARQTLQEKYSGTLKVQAGEEVEALDNPVDAEITRLLDQIYQQPGVDQDLEFDDQRIRQSLIDQVASLAAKWDRSPVNSKLVSYDKETNSYEYSKEQNGQTLAQDRLVDALYTRIASADYGTPVEAVFSETPAERTQAQTKELYRVIGTFTTKLTNNKNRNQNVKLAADAINGKILQPGEEFSFNEATGNRTSEKGYQPAGAYRNGVLIEEPGGGVCQVSTTLYHSIVESGFKTTERNAHSFAPSYVEKGQDAMVSFDGYDGPDLKFKNTGDAPIVLRASLQGLELKISIVGIPVMEDGMEVSIRSEKIRDVEPPAPVYEEDPTLPYGTEKVVEAATNGSVWKSYRVYKKNGEVVKEEPLHNSTYKAKPAQIKRNTTVMTEPTEAVDPAAAGQVPETTQATDATQTTNATQATNAGGEAETTQAADAAGTTDPAGAGESTSPAESAATGDNPLVIPQNPGN